jgi:hypothetical protein
MTVTIITENVMAHRRAGEICPSVTGSTELTPTHYVITTLAWAVDLACLLLGTGVDAGLTTPI